MDPKDFYTIAEIADRLRMRVSGVRGRLKSHPPCLPPSIRVGGRRLFPRAEYEMWKGALLKNRSATAQESCDASATEVSAFERSKA